MLRKARRTTLLWEALRTVPEVRPGSPSNNGTEGLRIQRLRFDKRCTAVTKSGRRCRGRIRGDSDFCPFHDPAVPRERRREIAAKGGKSRHRLARLPDGYLRKLTSRRAVGEAMDRLYREVRLGILTPEMGAVLFGILTRILDSDLLASGPPKRPSSRSKAEKIRPKLRQLLTRADRAAWQAAVANAPVESADAKSAG